MRKKDKTSMGGANERFRTTNWTNILHAQEGDESARKAAIAGLVGAYWKPVYCFLRRKGHSNEEAKDLTQGFFQEIVLGQGLVGEADRAKGRFRNFLLVSLNHYAESVHRADHSLKRRPKEGLVSLEGIELFDEPEPAGGLTPEESFHRDWAAALIGQVLVDVQHQCQTRGEENHWNVFSARVLHPILAGTTPPSLDEVCGQFGIANASRASNMIVTAKRRFQAALTRRVRPLVASDAAVAEEIDNLMAILAQSSAG